MAKYLLVTMCVLATTICNAQKIGVNTYNKVDSLIEYDNATIVIYRDKSGKRKKDVVKNKSVKINDVDVVIVADGKYTTIKNIQVTTVNQTGGQSAGVIINN